MIEEMRLRDLGVIAEATLPMGPGFTAITGETGAGKTMVVTGLGLLLGQRADFSAVRAGAAQASVDGVWIVPEVGAVSARVREAGGDVEPLGDGRAELLVGRTISSEGRSRATVGGRSAPAGVLADLADELVVVHGQSDQLRLRSAAAQRGALDRFGGAAVQGALEAYRTGYERWRTIDTELSALIADRDVRAEEAAQLRTALGEIEQAAPVRGEDAELNVRAERLANAEELRIAAATAHEALSGEGDGPDAGTLIAGARRALERGSERDPALAELSDQTADLAYRIADLAGSLAVYLADLDESGPHELAAVEDRRAVLGTLIRAHGSLDAAIDLLESGSARLSELDDDGERIERLTAERGDAASALDEAAAVLTAARTAAAAELGEAVTAEIRALAMPDARLTVAVTPGNATTSGRDDISLLLAPHPGADPRPVARSASGGELSRVMLAIEVVLAGADPVPTFVFDEVDAGIGGAAAIEVGRRLARLAEASQVIAVTHLAQVAAFATNHLSVVKASDGAVTASDVRRLEGAEREAEMARLLSGMPDSDAALSHARELLSLRTGGH
ncbi:DNA repair protein RecN [Microbacterium sp. P5_E9]